jgi:hypothetical protein
MQWNTEMRVSFGSGSLDDDRFDALADALAAIEDADPAIEDADLTASLAEGWVSASMVIESGDLGSAGQKLVATVRSALHKIGGATAGWESLAELVHEECMAVQPARDRETVGA